RSRKIPALPEVREPGHGARPIERTRSGFSGANREAKKASLLQLEKVDAGTLPKPGGKSAEPKKYQLCFERRYMTVPPVSNAPICGESTVAAEEHTVSYKDRDGE